MEEKEKVIDFGVILTTLKKKKKRMITAVSIAFVLSSFFILCMPRYYTASSKLAPEMGSSKSKGTLSSLASSFGFDLSQLESSDAITPLLYPDLMEDNGFVASLATIRVKTKDGKVETTYYDYLNKHQKFAWWDVCLGGLKKMLSSKDTEKNDSARFNPYMLSKSENGIIEGIRHDVVLNVDKKTGVISVTTTAQDPLVCKIIADSAVARLQTFITRYRTNKARIDYKYYQKLAKEAKSSYEEARRRYGSYSDANTDLFLASYKSKQEDLENEMQLRYNTYSTINTQLQTARAKVQELSPAFTILKGADVPLRPAGPKRVLFVLAVVFLTFVVTGLVTLYKE